MNTCPLEMRGVTPILETDTTLDKRLNDPRKIQELQWVKLPRCGREGAVEVRPFEAKKKLRASEAQGLSGEAVKGNPTTTVIPRVDESKITPKSYQNLTRPLTISRASGSRPLLPP